MEEVDESCVAIVYNREKKRILDEMDSLRDNLKEIAGEATFLDLFSQSLDDFIAEQSIKALKVLKNKYYKKEEVVPSAGSHMWIGINPPPQKYNLIELDQLMANAIMKYKFLDKHAYTLEAHTDNGYRPHIHLMIIVKEKPNRIITALANHFRVEKPSIECKAYHKGTLFGEHYDYITGQKCTEKQVNVKADQRDKEDLGISLFVENIFS